MFRPLAQLMRISIHAPREGGDKFVFTRSKGILISIHAPREGGDEYDPIENYNRFISIHAPREGGDFMLMESGVSADCQFQSTPPARGATHGDP